MSTPCQKIEVIDIIKNDVKEIKTDIKDLLQFKNRILGITIATSTFCTLVAHALGILIK